MMWDKPFELTAEEYNITYKCLNLSKFDVQHDDGCVSTYRKTTGELVLLHFFPGVDDIKYRRDNLQHTYYQTVEVSTDEQRPPEQMPRQIVIEDPTEAQRFFNAIMQIQKEREQKENETV